MLTVRFLSLAGLKMFLWYIEVNNYKIVDFDFLPYNHFSGFICELKYSK